MKKGCITILSSIGSIVLDYDFSCICDARENSDC